MLALPNSMPLHLLQVWRRRGLSLLWLFIQPFLQRGYDQIVHDVAIQKLPVRVCNRLQDLWVLMARHMQGQLLMAYLGTLPDFVLMAAADEAELVNMVHTSVYINDRPSAFRYPRGSATGMAMLEKLQLLEIGKGRIIREGQQQIAILSYGTRLRVALLLTGSIKKVIARQLRMLAL